MTEHRRDAVAAGAPRAVVPLDPTGVPGLDEVLGGGIQRGSLAIIAGPPGGGKTILAHHIAFSAARTGRRTAILTAFSEPTNKLIAHMRPFAFFDDDLLGQSLVVLSIQQFLRQGLESAADEIVAVVRAAQAELVVIDGFRGVRETADQPEAARRFVYDLSNRLSLLGITLLLTSEANVRDVAFFPEATTADVLLGLAYDAVDARDRRTLEVLKVRGSAPLSGRHTLTIGDEGVSIYPRLEARVARLASVNRPLAERRAVSAALGDTGAPPAQGAALQRTTTGVAGLDALLDGGLASGASTLVLGERGVGKTLFGLQFALEGVRQGEPALFVSFRETERQLAVKAQPFQWGAALPDALASGALTVLRTPPIELRVDVLADNVFTLLDETGARRLVLDEIGEIEFALTTQGYSNRFHDFLAALVEALRLRGVTALLTHQTAVARRPTLERALSQAASLASNVLWLRQALRGAAFDRALAIVQTELSNQPAAQYAITIQPPEGISLLNRPAAGESRRKPGSIDKYMNKRTNTGAGEERRDEQR